MRHSVALPQTERVDINGVELEVHERGSGEPVVFTHSLRDEWYGVLAEPTLNDQYRLIYYHRRGHGESDDTGLPISVEQQAQDCQAVMQHFNLDRAHVTGLSMGGAFALQFALDHPDPVHSLTLLEPTIPAVMDADSKFDHQLALIKSLFEAGEMAEGLDAFLEYIAGPGYEDRFNQTLPPGWFDRHLADWGAFQHDISSLQAWEFGEADAARITAPVLNMKAADSLPRHQQYHETIQSWIPHAESAIVENSTHPMPGLKPRETAKKLADFFARHSMEH